MSTVTSTETSPDLFDVAAGLAEEARVSQAINNVRLRYHAVRLSMGGLPQSRKLRDEHKNALAQQLGADAATISASSKLFDKNEPAVKRYREEHQKLQALFKDRRYTLPTGRPGLRMMKRDQLSSFYTEMQAQTVALQNAAQALAAELSQIVERERSRRGEAFDVSHYKDISLDQLSRVELDFPVISESQELAQIDHNLYREELEKANRTLREIVERTEEEMREMLLSVVQQAVESLSDNEDGERRVFRDSTVNRVFEMIEHVQTQMRENQIGGPALEQTANQIQAILLANSSRNGTANALRSNDAWRQQVRDSLATVADTLSAATVAPVTVRRRITRATD